MAYQITTLQLIITVFALFALSRTVLRGWDKAISRGEALFWSSIWIGVVIAAIHPRIIKIFPPLVGTTQDGSIIILYVGLILLYYLTFRLYVLIEKTNQDITKIVREIAKEKPTRKESKKNDKIPESHR